MPQARDLKWGVRQRLEVLERELFWNGRINRNTLAEKTGISKAQASLDLGSYKDLAGPNLVYSLSEKTYLAAPNFTARLIDISTNEFLSSHVGTCAEHIPSPHRNIDPDCLRVVHHAVENKGWVTIDYQSMSSQKIKSRTIAPHFFISDGFRWHLRAYDFSVRGFRDFVLGRILIAVETMPVDTNGEHQWKEGYDKAWHAKVDLILMPHPGLSDSQKEAITRDYQMIGGRVVFTFRQAYLIYPVARMRLLDEAKDPATQQVVLVNRDEIAGYFK